MSEDIKKYFEELDIFHMWLTIDDPDSVEEGEQAFHELRDRWNKLPRKDRAKIRLLFKQIHGKNKKIVYV